MKFACDRGNNSKALAELEVVSACLCYELREWLGQREHLLCELIAWTLIRPLPVVGSEQQNQALRELRETRDL